MQRQNSFHYRKSDSRSLDIPLVVRTRPVISVPHMRYLILRNSQSMVYYMEKHLLALSLQLDKRIFVISRILHRIRDEVVHYLQQLVLIAVNVAVLARLELQVEAVMLVKHLEALERCARKLNDIDSLLVKDNLIGLKLRHVHHLNNELVKTVGLRDDYVEVLVSFGWIIA